MTYATSGVSTPSKALTSPSRCNLMYASPSCAALRQRAIASSWAAAAVSSSSSASLRFAALRRLRTVPTGTPHTSAIAS